MATKTARRPLIPGFSRKEIAERLGVSWRTVEGWEQGRKLPLWIKKQLTAKEEGK
jgi:DNA-binding transcriptional regulator YiaG